MKFKNFIGSIFVLILICCGVAYLGGLFAPASTSESINSIRAFHSMPEQSIELMAFGTSHVWKGFDAKALQQKYGISAFNYGGNWQGINTTLLFVQDAFRTQTPKVILVDTYVAYSLIKDIPMEGQIYYTRAISDFPGKRKFLKTCFGDNKERYLSYYVPIVAFHENWINLNEDNFIKKRTKQDYIDSLGYDPSDDVSETNLLLYQRSVNRELPEDAIAILDEMVELCKKNDTELVFFTSPYEGVYDYAGAMERYAAQKGCYYINLFEKIEEMGLDSSTDFRDTQHLNDEGSKKVALYLGKYVIENDILK